MYLGGNLLPEHSNPVLVSILKWIDLVTPSRLALQSLAWVPKHSVRIQNAKLAIKGYLCFFKSEPPAFWQRYIQLAVQHPEGSNFLALLNLLQKWALLAGWVRLLVLAQENKGVDCFLNGTKELNPVIIMGYLPEDSTSFHSLSSKPQNSVLKKPKL